MKSRSEIIEELAHALQSQSKIQFKHEEFLFVGLVVNFQNLDLCDRIRKEFQLQLSFHQIDIFLICYEQFLGFQVMSRNADQIELMLNYKIPYSEVSLELL